MFTRSPSFSTRSTLLVRNAPPVLLILPLVVLVPVVLVPATVTAK
jgi:hypothetical protein